MRNNSDQDVAVTVLHRFLHMHVSGATLACNTSIDSADLLMLVIDVTQPLLRSLTATVSISNYPMHAYTRVR
jgi:hypothetical protein